MQLDPPRYHQPCLGLALLGTLGMWGLNEAAKGNLTYMYSVNDLGSLGARYWSALVRNLVV